MMTAFVQLTSNLGPFFELGPTAIRKREKGVETVFALDDIVRVRAFMLGGGGGLELVTADGRKMIVVSSREMGRGSPRLTEPARGQYRAFVAALHSRLVASGRPIDFVRGLIFKKRYDPRAIPEAVLP